jgi:hypothetical protein
VIWADSFHPWAGGKKAGVGALADDALGKTLRNYKRQVAKRYRVVDPEQVERLLVGGPYWISTKLDGELWFLIKRDGEVALSAYNGRVLLGTPLVEEAARLLSDAPDLILAGELVASPKSESGRARVHHVATALNDEELEETLSFHAFDLVLDDGKDTQLSEYATRIERIRALLARGERVSPVETVEGETADVVRLYREWVVSDRFEGVVVRSERGLTYKIKSTLTIDAVIIAFGERITGDVHQVREMSVALKRDDGTWQLLGAVGNGFSEQDRARWFERLDPMEVPSRFRLANKEGTLSRFVRPEIVVEIRCSDLLATDSWDAPIKRMALSYSDLGWAPVMELPTAVMIHPIFLRERTDKDASEEDVGMTQITSTVPLASPGDAGGAKLEAMEAEIVRRAVFEKTTTDSKTKEEKTAVRKYAVISTHRVDDRNFAPYLAFFTDYSPGRKDPLQTTLRPASSMDKIEGLVTGWLADSVKRGWSEVETARVGTPVTPPPEAAAILEGMKAKAAPKKKSGGRAKKKAEPDAE